jgi:hypothetical protein
MVYLRHYWLRVFLAAIIPKFIVGLLPDKLQTRLWFKIHGAVRNRRRFPRVVREYVIYKIIKAKLPQAQGPRSILEFGCSTGLLTRQLLHFLDIEKTSSTDVEVFAFDTFEGLPKGDDKVDFQMASVDHREGLWAKGSFVGDKNTLDSSLKNFGFRNYRLVQGLFSESLSTDMLQVLRDRPPFLVIIDCDYYSSTAQIFETLLAVLPNGCIFYFDDSHMNFYSTLSGELRAVKELNAAKFGEGYELVEAYDLGMLGRRFFRFVSLNAPLATPAEDRELGDMVIKVGQGVSPNNLARGD